MIVGEFMEVVDEQIHEPDPPPFTKVSKLMNKHNKRRAKYQTHDLQ